MSLTEAFVSQEGRCGSVPAGEKFRQTLFLLPFLNSTFAHHFQRMTLTTLQFYTLADLAAFSKLIVADRGYRISVKDLTLRCQLSGEELQTALHDYRASIAEGQ
jgi:hypothetical protein